MVCRWDSYESLFTSMIQAQSGRGFSRLTAVSKEVTLLIRLNIATSKCWWDVSPDGWVTTEITVFYPISDMRHMRRLPDVPPGELVIHWWFGEVFSDVFSSGNDSTHRPRPGWYSGQRHQSTGDRAVGIRSLKGTTGTTIPNKKHLTWPWITMVHGRCFLVLDGLRWHSSYMFFLKPVNRQ